MDNLDFGQLLEKYLRENSRRQTWLADEIGYSQQTISKWIVNGFRPNSAKVVNQIADALQLDNESRRALLVAADYAVEPPLTALRKGVASGAEFGSTESEVIVTADNFIPAEGLSHEGLANALEIAKRTNRRLVLGYALIAVGLAFVITMFVSPAAREAAVRTAAPILERLERLRDDSQPDTPSGPTPDLEILPTSESISTPLSPETPTVPALSTTLTVTTTLQPSRSTTETAESTITTTVTVNNESPDNPLPGPATLTTTIGSPSSSTSTFVDCEGELVSGDQQTLISLIYKFSTEETLTGEVSSLRVGTKVLVTNRNNNRVEIRSPDGQTLYGWVAEENVNIPENCNI